MRFPDDYWYPPNASPLDVQDQQEIDAILRQADIDGVEPCRLYRYFDDHARLLYVGITITPRDRLNNHRINSTFWEFAHCNTTFIYPNRKAARAAERLAITTEYPVFNKAGRPREHCTALIEQYLNDLEAAGRLV